MLTFLKANKNYILLTLIGLFMFTSAIMISINLAKKDERIFCQILVVHTAYPVPKPTNPKVDKEQEKAWRLYQVRLETIKQLGC